MKCWVRESAYESVKEKAIVEIFPKKKMIFQDKMTVQ